MCSTWANCEIRLNSLPQIYFCHSGKTLLSLPDPTTSKLRIILLYLTFARINTLRLWEFKYSGILKEMNTEHFYQAFCSKNEHPTLLRQKKIHCFPLRCCSRCLSFPLIWEPRWKSIKSVKPTSKRTFKAGLFDQKALTSLGQQC